MAERMVIDRRKLLVATALVGGAAAAAPAGDARPPGHTETINGVMAWKPGFAVNPVETDAHGYRFFNPDEAAFMEAAVDRIIPPDHNGPGAKEAGVTYFIDRQLLGDFGRGDHYYLQGPWPQGTKTQGYQSRFTPADLYRAGIKGVDGWCKDQHGHLFRDLSADLQDSTFKACESGDAKLQGVSSKTWFTLFLQNVQEGYWSDPIYGGNRNMAGWKMIGFPGAHYDYAEWIHRHNEPWPHPPVGLEGRPQWSES